MSSPQAKSFVLVIAISIISILMCGCGGGESPADPGGGGGGGGGGTGDYTIDMLTTGLGIHDVWGSAANQMVAVGASGLIMNYDGESWRNVPSPVSVDLQAVWGSASNDIWAVGQVGTLIHFDGSQWSIVASPVSASWAAIWGAAADDIWVGGPGGALAHFDGSTWQSVDSGTTQGIFSLTGASSTEVWAGCSFGTLATYNGATWSAEKITVNGAETNSHLYDLWYASDTQTLYATGFSFYLMERQTSGDWSTAQIAGTSSLYAIWGRSSTDFYVTDFGGTVVHWNGSNYFPSTVSPGRRLIGIWGVDSGETFAVGAEGSAVHSAANVRTWDVDQYGSGHSIKALWGLAGNDLEMIADGGKAYHYNGDQFVNYSVDVNTSYTGMWGSAQVAPMTVGWGGVVQLSGTSWSSVWAGNGGTYYGIGGIGDEIVVATGADGAVEARGPSGWLSLADLGTENLRGVWAADADNVFIAGSDGSVHNLGAVDWNAPMATSGRTSWDSVDTGVDSDFSDVWGTSATNVYFVGVTGQIVHFDGTDFSLSLDVASGGFSAIWGSSAADIWAVGRDGLVYHFDGVEWEKIETGISLWIHDVYGFGGNEIYFVMDGGTVVKVGVG